MPDPIRKLLGAAMILAPVAGLVSAVASPALRSDASATIAEITGNPDRWYVYALFVTVSMWLFVAAVVGLVSLLAQRAPRLSAVGGALALLGALVATGDATTELMYWQMGAPGADRAQMTALADRYENATGSSLLFTVGGLALIAGLVILAIGLWQFRVVPAWAALGIPAGAIVNIAGFSLNSNALVIVSNVVLLATLGWIGRSLLSEPATGESRTAGVAAAAP